MTDREKLELAAKAMGMVVHNFVTDEHGQVAVLAENNAYWQPEHDQADSDRMAGKLRISTLFNDGYVYCFNGGHGSGMITHNNTDEDVCRAVREARMLVAVEIGRAME